MSTVTTVDVAAVDAVDVVAVDVVAVEGEGALPVGPVEYKEGVLVGRGRRAECREGVTEERPACNEDAAQAAVAVPVVGADEAKDLTSRDAIVFVNFFKCFKKDVRKIFRLWP